MSLEMKLIRKMGFQDLNVTPLKTNISPEKWWFEDAFPIEIVPFFGDMLLFRGVGVAGWLLKVDPFLLPIRCKWRWHFRAPTKNGRTTHGGFTGFLFTPKSVESFCPTCDWSLGPLCRTLLVSLTWICLPFFPTSWGPNSCYKKNTTSWMDIAVAVSPPHFRDIRWHALKRCGV